MSTDNQKEEVGGVHVRKRPTGEEPSVEEASETATEASSLTSPPPAQALPAEATAPTEAAPQPAEVTSGSPPAPAEEPVSAEAPTSMPSAPPPEAVALAASPAIDPKPEDSVDFGRLLGQMSVGTVEQGEIVTGRLVAVSGEWAFIDLGGKSEGLLSAAELQDGDGKLTVGVGDEVEAFVVSTRGGEIKLSQSLSRSIKDYGSLRDAYEGGIPVEGRVASANKGGYEVTIAGKRAFCPISQIDLNYTEDPAVHVGRTYDFRVSELAEKGKRIVVSRAALLREERKRKREELLTALDVGVVMPGVVKTVQDYGAFVDIGGIEGLIHVSQLSWRRVEHPSEVVNVGDQVQVKILNIKQTDKGERIGLSLREAQPHPWVAVGTTFKTGETYDGTVTRLADFGAFVELGPGIEGLIHVSEISWSKRINHASEVLEVGQTVRVYLKNIDEERQRIGLSLKALEANPWSEARDKYGVGTQVKGVVEKIEAFGIFLTVEEGLTGLIPGSESNTGQGSNLRREFKLGQELTATVLSVDPHARRMSLSLKDASEREDRAEVKKYLTEQKKDPSSGFGTLGDLFAKKLGKG